jgi:large subunit ribosomal protein L30
MLIAKRARLRGDRKLTEEYLQKVGFKSAEDLAGAVFDCRIEYWRLRDITPFFRLRPPSKGFKGSVKKSIAAGGESGYRGAKIDELLIRMI